MADSTVDDTCDESIIIQRINYEREKILEVLNHSQMQYPIEIPVLKKYLLADRATLESLQSPDDMDRILKHNILSFEENLKIELEALYKELSSTIETSENMRKDIQRLKKREADLKSMDVFTTNSLINSENIGMVEKKIKAELLKEKAELKIVLAEILPEDLDTRDLLADLVTSGYENPEEYTTLDNVEGISERIELLMKMGLFELDPTNSLRIRMLDLND